MRTSLSYGRWFAHVALGIAFAMLPACEGCGERVFLNGTFVFGGTSWRRGPLLETPRATHAAVELDGDVLVLGGQTEGGDRDRAVERCRLDEPGCEVAGELLGTHEYAEAISLTNGKVLITPGTNGTAFELFDPTAHTARTTGTLTRGGRLVTLADGRVLVVQDERTYIYSPGADQWTDGPERRQAATGSQATRLSDGRVLLSGGFCSPCDRAHAEIIDVEAGTSTEVASMHASRQFHRTTALPDGRILVVGGAMYGEPGAEVYDPPSDRWTVVGDPSTNRIYHAVTLLRDGRVLVTGGQGDVEPATLFDPSTGAWTSVPGLPARSYHAAAALPDGSAVVIGGDTGYLDEDGE